jgi:hypothetical protein
MLAWAFLGGIMLAGFGVFDYPYPTGVKFKNKYKKIFIFIISGPIGWVCLVDSKISKIDWSNITVIDNIVKWFKN